MIFKLSLSSASIKSFEAHTSIKRVTKISHPRQRAAACRSVDNFSQGSPCHLRAATYVLGFHQDEGRSGAMHRRGPPNTSDAIMKLQLERLASSILAKSPHELAEIATVNPAIYREWIDEIQRRNDEAREEARVFSQALQYLLKAPADGDRPARR
jgi:hypothetical protein